MPKLPLYSSKTNEVQERSGLNWGSANAHTNIGDACIALTKDFFKQNPNFFPSQGKTIKVLWDDGCSMVCLLEGTQEIDGQIYPKQLSSYRDKSYIGVYLRQRLNVSPSHHIKKNILDEYGRDYIDVSKQDDVYYFDFSV